ncbi:MAG: large conductance mechanosensitive channel protein MscL [Nocardioidaceae bacterium]
MLKGFKDFIMRGNLVELAVAFIIGGAFATVVTTFTAMLLSVITKATGKGLDFSTWQPGKIPVGAFITALIAFLILAAVVYFFVVTPYNKLQARMARGEEAAPPAPDIALLTEIRDLLAGQRGTGTVSGGGGLS